MGFYVFESVSTNQDGDADRARHLDQHRARGLREERAMSELEDGDPLPELRVTPDAGLTKRYAEASGDLNPIHIDPEFAKSVGLPGLHPARPLLDGPGRARAHRASPAATRGRCKRLAVQFRGMGLPEQEIVVTTTVTEADDGPDRHRHRGRPGRQPDHPQRRGRARARLSVDGSSGPWPGRPRRRAPRIRACSASASSGSSTWSSTPTSSRASPVGSTAIADGDERRVGPLDRAGRARGARARRAT